MATYKEEIISDIEKIENEFGTESMHILKKIKDYDCGDSYHNKIKPRFKKLNSEEYDSFVNTLYQKYLDIIFETLNKNSSEENNATLRREIRDFALAFDNIKYHQYNILSRLADQESFEILLKECNRVVETEIDYYVDGEPILALLKLYDMEEYRERIHRFLLNSYEQANQNSDVYLVISQGIISLAKDTREKYADLLFKAYEFASSEQRKSYGMHQVSGYMALYLTGFSQKIDIEVFDKCLSTMGENYHESKFIFQTRYAKWYLEGDCSEAMNFLEKSKYCDQLGYVAALLADLNCKKALPVLEKKLNEISNLVVTEIFLESMSRLKSQLNRPDTQSRMIWMFESKSPTQMVLGASSDTIFIQRAREKTEINNTVYESDAD